MNTREATFTNTSTPKAETHYALAPSRVSFIMSNLGSSVRHGILKLRDGGKEAEMAARIAYSLQRRSQY